jgi:hypothetical protein
MVASHTGPPLGGAKWLGKRHHTTYILADMQGTRAEHVAYHKGRLILGGVTPYQPFRNTQGRFCMAGYHCLMPNGISFVATQHKSNTHGISSDETQHKSNGLTAFIPLQKHQQSNAYSISSSKTWLQSVYLSAFLH